MEQYNAIAKAYREAIEAVLWNEEDGVWYDYDYKHEKHRKRFYPTNITPLYTRSFNYAKGSEYGSKAYSYLEREGITDYIGKYFGKNCFIIIYMLINGRGDNIVLYFCEMRIV